MEACDETDAGESQATEVVRYLSRTQVAHDLGLKSFRSISIAELPPHDAVIGNRKAWLPETIEVWKRSRPGRGYWRSR